MQHAPSSWRAMTLASRCRGPSPLETFCDNLVEFCASPDAPPEAQELLAPGVFVRKCKEADEAYVASLPADQRANARRFPYIGSALTISKT